MAKLWDDTSYGVQNDSPQLKMYNLLTRGGTPGARNENFFARRGRSIENAFGTTGAALVNLVDNATEDRNIEARNSRFKQNMNDIYKKYGYNSADDYYNAKDEAEKLFDKYGFNSEDYWQKHADLWSPSTAGSDEVKALEKTREDAINRMSKEDADKIRYFENIQNELKGQASSNANEAKKAAEDWKDYRTNSYVGKKINQDRGKFAGSALNTLSTMTDVMLPTAGIALNAVQGGVEGVADELEDNGFKNFDWGRAGQNALVGAVTGGVTGGINKGINKIASSTGNLLPSNNVLGKVGNTGVNVSRKVLNYTPIKSNNIAGQLVNNVYQGSLRGALSGGYGGATGAGLSAALNGQDVLGSALQGYKQGIEQGAMAGGIMGGANTVLRNTPGVGNAMRQLDQAGENWKNSGNNFNERLTNTLTSGDSGIGNWLQGKPSRMLASAGQVGNSIRNVDTDSNPLKGITSAGEAADIINNDKNLYFEGVPTRNSRAILDDLSTAMRSIENIPGATESSAYQRLASVYDQANKAGGFANKGDAINALAEAENTLDYYTKSPNVGEGAYPYRDDVVNSIANLREDVGTLGNTVGINRLGATTSPESGFYDENTKALINDKNYEKGYLGDNPSKARLQSYNDSSDFMSRVLDGDLTYKGNDEVAYAFNRLSPEAQSDVLNRGRNFFSKDFMDTLGASAQTSTNKYVSVDPLGNRTEYTPDDIAKLIDEYDNYQAPKTLSGNSSSEAGEVLGDAGSKLLSIYDTMNGGNVGLDPVYNKQAAAQFQDWINTQRTNTGTQTPTASPIKYGDNEIEMRNTLKKYASKNGLDSEDLGTMMSVLDESDRTGRTFKQTDNLYSRKSPEVTRKLVQNATELQNLVKTIDADTSLTRKAKSDLVNAAKRVYESANSALDRGGKWEADNDFTAGGVWSGLDRADETGSKYASQIRDIADSVYDAFKQRTRSGKEYSWDDLSSQGMPNVASETPTTAAGWLKKAGQRVVEDMNNTNLGLRIKDVGETPAQDAYTQGKGSFSDALDEFIAQGGNITRNGDVIPGQSARMPQAQEYPTDIQNMRVADNTAEQPYLAYGESDLGNRTRRGMIADSLSRLGDTLEGAQADVTRAATRKLGIDSTGKVIENVRKKTGLTNLETQAKLAKELTGGEKSLMDNIQRQALSASEDGKLYKVDTEPVSKQVESIVDKYAGASMFGSQSARDKFISNLRRDISSYDADVLTIANRMKANAADLRGKGIAGATGIDAAKAKIYSEVADKLDDLSYNAIPKQNVNDMFDATISEMRGRAEQAARTGNKDIAKAYNTLASRLDAEPRTIAAYRSFKKDFVDVAKIDKLSGQAENGAAAQMGRGFAGGLKRFTGTLLQRPANAALAKIGGAINAGADRMNGNGGGDVTVPTGKAPFVPEYENPATQLYNAIGRTEGQIQGNQAKYAKYLADNAQEAVTVPNTSVNTLEDLASATVPTTSATSVYNTMTGTQNTQTPRFNSVEEERAVYFYPPTGDKMTDMLSQAMRRASNAKDYKALGQLYEMYVDTLSAAQKRASSSNEQEKLTDTQRRAYAAESSLNELAGMSPDLGYQLSNIPVVGNIATLGGNTYQSAANSLATQIGYMLSGANIKEDEAARIGQSYVPQPFDSEATRQSKLQRAKQIIEQYKNTYTQPTSGVAI